MERKSEISDSWTFLAAHDVDARAGYAPSKAGDTCEKFLKTKELSADVSCILDDIHPLEDIYRVDQDIAWQHCLDLDEILDIGEPKNSLLTQREVDDSGILQDLSVFLATDVTPKIAPDEGKRNVLRVIDELINAYEDEAFQSNLQPLLKATRKLTKRRKDDPLMYAEGREELCFKVQRVILQENGFTGLERGLAAFALAAMPYFKDQDVQEKMSRIDMLLGLPPKNTFMELRYWVKYQQPNLIV